MKSVARRGIRSHDPRYTSPANSFWRCIGHLKKFIGHINKQRTKFQKTYRPKAEFPKFLSAMAGLPVRICRTVILVRSSTNWASRANWSWVHPTPPHSSSSPLPPSWKAPDRRHCPAKICLVRWNCLLAGMDDWQRLDAFLLSISIGLAKNDNLVRPKILDAGPNVLHLFFNFAKTPDRPTDRPTDLENLR